MSYFDVACIAHSAMKQAYFTINGPSGLGLHPNPCRQFTPWQHGWTIKITESWLTKLCNCYFLQFKMDQVCCSCILSSLTAFLNNRSQKTWQYTKQQIKVHNSPKCLHGGRSFHHVFTVDQDNKVNCIIIETARSEKDGFSDLLWYLQSFIRFLFMLLT